MMHLKTLRLALIYTAYFLMLTGPSNGWAFITSAPSKGMLIASYCAKRTCSSQSVPLEMQAAAIECQAKVSSQQCQNFIKAEPEFTYSLKKCDIESICKEATSAFASPTTAADMVKSCTAGFLEGTGKNISDVIEMLKTLWEDPSAEDKELRTFIAACNTNLACKRELANQVPHLKNVSDKVLKKWPAHALYAQTKYKKSPTILQVLDKMVTKAADIQCLDSTTRAEMYCWGASYLIDPTLVAGLPAKGVKSAQYIQKLIQTTQVEKKVPQVVLATEMATTSASKVANQSWVKQTLSTEATVGHIQFHYPNKTPAQINARIEKLKLELKTAVDYEKNLTFEFTSPSGETKKITGKVKMQEELESLTNQKNEKIKELSRRLDSDLSVEAIKSSNPKSAQNALWQERNKLIAEKKYLNEELQGIINDLQAKVDTTQKDPQSVRSVLNKGLDDIEILNDSRSSFIYGANKEEILLKAKEKEELLIKLKEAGKISSHKAQMQVNTLIVIDNNGKAHNVLLCAENKGCKQGANTIKKGDLLTMHPCGQTGAFSTTLTKAQAVKNIENANYEINFSFETITEKASMPCSSF